MDTDFISRLLIRKNSNKKCSCTPPRWVSHIMLKGVKYYRFSQMRKILIIALSMCMMCVWVCKNFIISVHPSLYHQSRFPLKLKTSTQNKTENKLGCEQSCLLCWLYTRSVNLTAQAQVVAVALLSIWSSLRQLFSKYF